MLRRRKEFAEDSNRTGRLGGPKARVIVRVPRGVSIGTGGVHESLKLNQESNPTTVRVDRDETQKTMRRKGK